MESSGRVRVTSSPDPARPGTPFAWCVMAREPRSSAHGPLFALLVFLALDAQRGLGPRLEPLLADRLIADLADPEGAVRDLLERQVQLGQQALLAAAQAELERLEVLARRQVHLVRQVVGVERHVLHRQHLAGAVEDRLPLFLEELLKLLQLLLGELLGRRWGDRGAHGSLCPLCGRGRRVEKRDRIVMSDEYDNPPDHERIISESGCRGWGSRARSGGLGGGAG